MQVHGTQALRVCAKGSHIHQPTSLTLYLSHVSCEGGKNGTVTDEEQVRAHVCWDRTDFEEEMHSESELQWKVTKEILHAVKEAHLGGRLHLTSSYTNEGPPTLADTTDF